MARALWAQAGSCQRKELPFSCVQHLQRRGRTRASGGASDVQALVRAASANPALSGEGWGVGSVFCTWASLPGALGSLQL